MEWRLGELPHINFNRVYGRFISYMEKSIYGLMATRLHYVSICINIKLSNKIQYVTHNEFKKIPEIVHKIHAKYIYALM